MTPERWSLIKSIFHDAVEVEEPERAALLDERCEGDAELRAEVERLLRHHSSPTALGSRSVEGPSGDGASPGGTPFLRASDRFGSYRVLKVLGEGGMGVVYLAEQEKPKRTVALKMIRPGVATTQMMRRFEHEAQVLGRLQHPGIAQIFEAGATNTGQGPQPYFAMEYVRGKALPDFARENNLGTRERLELFAKVCDAVQHAHQKGVIHRDLKPGNILVDETGQPKILDFGVARAIDSDIQTTTLQTDIGQLIGTIPYMSPEQASGSADDLDTRSDVYSLGVILYELLAGRLPYDLTRKLVHEAVRIIQQEPPTRLSSISRTLRGDIETIAGKALEKDRSRRYQSAGDLGADIQRYLAHQPIVAHPPTLRYQLATLARRHRAAFIALGAVFATLAIGVGATTWEMLRAYDAEARAEHQKHEAGLALARAVESEARERQHAQAAEAASAEARERLRESLLARAHGARLGNRPGRRAEALDALGRAAAIRPGPDLRNEAIAAMALLDVSVRKRWPGDDITSEKVRAFDHRAARYARSNLNGDISIRRTTDDAEECFLPGFGLTAVIMIFTPDGTRLAVKYDREGKVAFALWDLGAPRMMLRIDRGMDEDALACSPDGTIVVAGGVAGDRSIHVYSASDGTERTHFDVGVVPQGLAIAPDSASVAVTSGDVAEVSLYEIATGTLVRKFTAPTAGSFAGAAFSPDGRRLAACSMRDYRVYIWDVGTGALSVDLVGHSAEPRVVSFSPVGTVVATSGWDRTSRLWDGTTGRLLLALPQWNCQFVGTTGTLGGFRTETVLLDLNPARECLSLRGHPGEKGPYQASFSASGALIVTSSYDGHRFWDAASGRELAFLPSEQSFAAFTGDGTSLVTASRRSVRRWPITEEGDTVRIGPPDVVSSRVALPGSTTRFASGGSRLVTPTRGGQVTITGGAGPGEITTQFDHPNSEAPSVSPDGTLLATTAFREDIGVRIWDTATSRMVAELPAKGCAHTFFSPDGRLLLAATREEILIYSTSDWNAPPRSGRIANELEGEFSPDSRSIALAGPGAVILLIDTARLEVLAAFTCPDDFVVRDLAFSPDGGRIAAATAGHVTFVWDLRAIRGNLVPMGLDWDAPPLPPAGSGQAAVKLVEIRE